ncbi:MULTISPECIES: LysR family transcriptional regulator [unclassified Colwellia]|jgi:DNA-binding transcriptional LysR family regulator|nr:MULTISPECIES: LysR family transcriptional regulator [unclassified Colwellia]MBA6302994.1 LysR family transcriptional regulator [Colwellia sp. MB02u-14]MBA6233621.1 LysR family transcriptional regulator [Colwellia sp. MB02u-7]MBA6238181.1 LysR family transcriptional regulator [Colwellia sp. MB02u-11]MBA6255055.1 LysR family transcriptional regulator [Colwellia sp. MB3u-28]MBA6258994.1 LysR family transcriptional regulator [Colwellia sp. MB3u-41]
MGQLEDMYIFLRVVETGSITKAAEQMNIAKSAVSKRLSLLEQKLGIKLINRTTRKSSITEAGQRYYHRSKLIVDEVDELNSQTTSSNSALEGTLNIAVPLSFGLTHLAPALDLFLQQHSDLKLNINFSDQKIDIVEQGVDLAFRIGQLDNSTLQARKIAPIKHVLCASPDYLVLHGKPITPDDLKQHSVIRYGSSEQSGIKLLSKEGQEHIVHLEPNIIANNGDFLKSLAESGHGITYLPTFIVWQSLATQTLVPVLEAYKLPTMHAYAVYPPNRHLPFKVRSLIDFLVERFGDNPYWDQ